MKITLTTDRKGQAHLAQAQKSLTLEALEAHEPDHTKQLKPLNFIKGSLLRNWLWFSMIIITISTTMGCANRPYLRGVFSRQLFDDDHFAEWEWLSREPLSTDLRRAEAELRQLGTTSENRDFLQHSQEERTPLEITKTLRTTASLTEETAVARQVASEFTRPHSQETHFSNHRRHPPRRHPMLDDEAVYRPLPTSLSLHFSQ